jgi:hypothetical protein
MYFLEFAKLLIHCRSQVTSSSSSSSTTTRVLAPMDGLDTSGKATAGVTADGDHGYDEKDARWACSQACISMHCRCCASSASKCVQAIPVPCPQDCINSSPDPYVISFVR